MNDQPINILVIDDDPALLAVLEAGLTMQDQYVVKATISAQEAMRLLQDGGYDIVVSDYSLNDDQINGLTILKMARSRPDHPCLVIIVTAFASLEISLEAIHLGAYDFLTKPFQLEELQLVVRNAADHMRLNRENQMLREQVGELTGAFRQTERQQKELVIRIREWLQESQASPYLPNESQMQDLRRRRLHEQIGTYLRIGESISEQMAHHRQKIETMFKDGLLPENVYRRVMETDTPEPMDLDLPNPVVK